MEQLKHVSTSGFTGNGQQQAYRQAPLVLMCGNDLPAEGMAGRRDTTPVSRE